MFRAEELLGALPIAAYTTDGDGRITYFNDAAAALWGHRPDIGIDRWCGSWRLFRADGTPLPHEECPLAVCLKEGHAISNVEAILERPDGTRIPFLPYATPMKDESGRVVGAMNLLIDITERKAAEGDLARLAAIVTSSDDAIVSKTLDGRVTTWNAAAGRIFGYREEEMIGQSITRIIPPELLNEEQDILSRLRRGERIEHYDTVRVAKDGRRVNVSLTVSPLRNAAGEVIGASKVARDITERKRNEELQRLLIGELNHRVKNTLATIQAIARQSLRQARDPRDFVDGFTGRVQALARAHDLLVQQSMDGADLAELLREQVFLGAQEDPRISCAGPAVSLDSRTTVQVALVLHELATNARKYGALSVNTGRLSIEWKLEMSADCQLLIEWRESGVHGLAAPKSVGFGTTLIKRSLQASGGEALLQYGATGVTCTLRLPLRDVHPKLRAPADRSASSNERDDDRFTPAVSWSGRVLVVEDEPLVALEIESELTDAGYDVVGPAGTAEAALRFISETPIDAALLDVGLAGQPSEGVLAALLQKRIPFAFATGHERSNLPEGFSDRRVLEKPFEPETLLRTVEELVQPKNRLSSEILAFRKRWQS